MKDINFAVVCGNIASEIWDNQSNVRFTVATNVYDFSQKKEIAKFISVVVFGKSADYVKNYAKKGDRMEITGSLENYEQTKDGKKTYSLSFIAKGVQVISKDFGSKETQEEKPTNNTDGYDMGEMPMED